MRCSCITFCGCIGIKVGWCKGRNYAGKLNGHIWKTDAFSRSLKEDRTLPKMPNYLKLIARFANLGTIIAVTILTVILFSLDRPALAAVTLAVAALLIFNFYLVEKSALVHSEEEWLAGEVRKALLRRKLARLTEENENLQVMPEVGETDRLTTPPPDEETATAHPLKRGGFRMPD